MTSSPTDAAPRSLGDLAAEVRDLRSQIARLESRQWSVKGGRAGRIYTNGHVGFTDGAGQVTLSHPLGTAPLFAGGSLIGTPDNFLHASDWTATTVTFTVINRTSGALPSMLVLVQWIVIA